MFELYKQTEMETKIEEMYKEKGILSPSDLEIQNLAKTFNIHIDYSLPEGPRNALWDEDTFVVFMKSNDSEEKQREVFYHEFGHLKLHCGDQCSMPKKSFRDLQEFQANQFKIYAAIPFFMLKELKLPAYDYQIVQLIQKTFKVSSKLARERLEQIKRRIIQTQIDKGEYDFDIQEDDFLVAEMRSKYPSTEDLFSPLEIKEFKLNPKKTKKNVVYFLEAEGKQIPCWYVINTHRGDVKWNEELMHFPIDDDFELVPLEECMELPTDAPVPASYLFLNPSKPNDFCIKLQPVRKMLLHFDVDPYDIRRFIIDVNELESLLQLNIFNDRIRKSTKTVQHQ